MQGMRIWIAFLLLALASCMHQPPAQEMADARAAVKAARELPGESVAAERHLQSAERALEEASEAMRQARYEKARHQAVKARREAQRAARIKQHPESSQ